MLSKSGSSGCSYSTLLMVFSVRFRYVVCESLKAFLIAGVSCVGIMALTAIYVVSPLDFIPDVIPVLGQVDDAVAVILALLSVPAATVGWIGRTIYVCVEALNVRKRLDE
ncbi:MAG: YkvA family protein [Victivallales bacterium]|jgi:hypothetical protein